MIFDSRYADALVTLGWLSSGWLGWTWLGANWVWVCLYFCVAGLGFVWLRPAPATAPAEAPPREPAGFGPPIRLREAVAKFLRLSCPRLIATVVVVAGVARLRVGQWSWWDGLIVVALVALWPLQESLIHIFLLHRQPFTVLGRRIDPVMAHIHRVHHRNPWDAELAITPIAIAWSYVCALPAVWLVGFSTPLGLTVIVTYFSLALNYEWLHFLMHTAYPPRTAFYRRLWRNHRLHHFKNENYWYGITMLSGDRWLGTQPTAMATARSPTCLTLGVDHELSRWTESETPPATNLPQPRLFRLPTSEPTK